MLSNKIKISCGLLLCTLAVLNPVAAGAQHFPSDVDLTSLIKSRVDENRAVGIVLGVIEADGTTRIVWSGDAGPNARPLGEKSVFEIGSITKVFTGIVLADITDMLVFLAANMGPAETPLENSMRDSC